MKHLLRCSPAQSAIWRTVLLAAFAAAAAGALLVAGCGGSASTNLVSPTAQKCQISVSGFTGAFAATGGTGSATIATSRDCSWSAAAESQWITFASTPQGQGDGTLAYQVAPNQAPAARTGTIAINGQRLSVTQEPAPCSYQLTPQSQRAAASGMSGTITVTAMAGCAWSSTAAVPWVSVLGTGHGSGTGTVSYSVAPNPGGERSGGISIAGLTFDIRQDGAPAPAPPPAPVPVPVPDPTPTPTPPPAPSPPPTPPPACQFSVAPASLSFGPDAASATVSVTTAIGCAWQAGTTTTWLTLSPALGTGPGAVTVSAAANTGSARAGSVSIAGQTVSVSQAAAPLPTVTLSGTVSNVSGSCPSLQFVVSNTQVTTSATTAYAGGPCKNVENGVGVTIDGTTTLSGTVEATRVTFLKGH